MLVLSLYEVGNIEQRSVLIITGKRLPDALTKLGTHVLPVCIGFDPGATKLPKQYALQC